jgi:hypothetical protein
MATIIKRGDSYRVQVRRKGQPSLSKTFSTAAAAKAWAKKAALEPKEEGIILAEGLRRYLKEVVPLKKGHMPERYRINKWLRDPLAQRPLGSIKPKDIAEWRNARMAEGRAPSRFIHRPIVRI